MLTQLRQGTTAVCKSDDRMNSFFYLKKKNPAFDNEVHSFPTSKDVVFTRKEVTGQILTNFQIFRCSTSALTSLVAYQNGPVSALCRIQTVWYGGIRKALLHSRDHVCCQYFFPWSFTQACPCGKQFEKQDGGSSLFHQFSLLSGLIL